MLMNLSITISHLLLSLIFFFSAEVQSERCWSTTSPST